AWLQIPRNALSPPVYGERAWPLARSRVPIAEDGAEKEPPTGRHGVHSKLEPLGKGGHSWGRPRAKGGCACEQASGQGARVGGAWVKGGDAVGPGWQRHGSGVGHAATAIADRGAPPITGHRWAAPAGRRAGSSGGIGRRMRVGPGSEPELAAGHRLPG